MKTVTVFDLETNGMVNDGDHVIQFGYMTLQNRRVKSEGSILFNRDLEWNPHAFKSHGISKDIALNFGIRPKVFYREDCKRIMGADIIVGHNIVKFDIPVLFNDYTRLGLEPPNLGYVFDTLEWARKRWGWKGGNKLQEVHLKLFGIEFTNAHNAYADVKATANIFDKIVRTDQRVVDELFDGDFSLYSKEF